ncbi:uncharacterized [Tachysurus ichikawai]
MLFNIVTRHSGLRPRHALERYPIQTDNPTRSSPPSHLHPSPFPCISMDASLSSTLVHNGSSRSQGSGLRGPVTTRLISRLKRHQNQEE